MTIATGRREIIFVDEVMILEGFMNAPLSVIFGIQRYFIKKSIHSVLS
ncbi:MAG: hypothetical protein AB7O96_15520 [Pseudobdellovibrionaceae bacterium]